MKAPVTVPDDLDLFTLEIADGEEAHTTEIVVSSKEWLADGPR